MHMQCKCVIGISVIFVLIYPKFVLILYLNFCILYKYMFYETLPIRFLCWSFILYVVVNINDCGNTVYFRSKICNARLKLIKSVRYMSNKKLVLLDYKS